MDNETKKIVKFGLIALVIMAIVFGGIYFMKSGKGGSHSHGNGAAHSH
jgi:hypothetical protein